MSVILFGFFCAIMFSIEKIRNRSRSQSTNAGELGFIQSRQMIDWPATTSQVHPETGIARSLKHIRVLLVDDHEIIRRGLASMLNAEPDLEVIGEAANGESAVDLARNTHPDIVLMDICMPGMDGIQATKAIRNELPEVRVIGLSMFQEREQQAAMLEAGAINYITKSGPSESLIGTIRTCGRSLG